MSKISYTNFLPHIENSYIAKLDGKQNNNLEKFLDNIWRELKFPYDTNKNYDAYLDWMRDLSWIESQNISLIISNQNDFLKEIPEYKKYFIEDAFRIIFPFWAEDAEQVFNNKKYLKNIDIYLLD